MGKDSIGSHVPEKVSINRSTLFSSIKKGSPSTDVEEVYGSK